VVPLTQEEKNQAWVKEFCPAPPPGSNFDIICEIMLKKLNSSTNSSPSAHNFISHLPMKLNNFKNIINYYDDSTDRPRVTSKLKTQIRTVVYKSPQELGEQRWFTLKHFEAGAFSFLSYRKTEGGGCGCGGVGGGGGGGGGGVGGGGVLVIFQKKILLLLLIVLI
jgi:hypothetical protein